MDPKVRQRVLARAAAKLGGVEALAARLQVGRRLLMAHITGGEPIPDALLLRAIDVILDELPGVLRTTPPASQPGETETP